MTNFIIAISAIVLALVALQIWLRRSSRKSVNKTLPENLTRGKEYDGDNSLLLYFYSPSCGACKRMMPAVEAFERSNPGRIKRVNVGESMELARAIGIMATPTVAVIRNRVVKDIRLGVLGEKDLAGMLS